MISNLESERVIEASQRGSKLKNTTRRSDWLLTNDRDYFRAGAIVETIGSGDQLYCANQVGPNGSFSPGHVFLATDGSGWQIGEFTSGVDDTPG